MPWHRRRPLERHRSGHRRRRLILSLIVVVVAVVVSVTLADQVGSQSRPYDRSVDLGFADQVNPLGTESAGTGLQLAKLLAGVSTDERGVVFEQLGLLDQQATETESLAAATTPPEPVGPAGPACLDALAGRARAMTQIQGAIERLLGGSTGVDAQPAGAATATLTAAGHELVVSDVQWAACRRALRRAPGAARLPASVWVPDPANWSETSMAGLVHAIAGSSTLAAAPALAIEGVATTPPALAATGTQPTYMVAASDALTVRVVVADTGNVALHQVRVQVQAQPTAGAKSGPPVKATVDLDPGAAKAVTLPGLRVQPGGSYQVVAQAAAKSSGSSGAGSVSVSAPSDSVAVTLAQAASLASVTPSANPVTVGHRVVYQAQVAGSLPGAGPPTGTVAFDDAGAPINGCAPLHLVRGQATCTVTYSAAGYHSITVVYSGTSSLAGSTSPAITETVNPAPAPSHT